jgi:hypothetical protein
MADMTFVESLHEVWRETYETPKKVTLADRACEHCGVRKQVMVTMAPGHNGEAWWLCARCWIDGLPNKKEAESDAA